jgi:predicted transcriptional regulator
MEVHLKPEVEAKLSRLAAHQGRAADTLVEDALERLVDHEEWFLAEVDSGIAAAARGDFVSREEIREMIARRYPGSWSFAGPRPPLPI